MQIAAHIDGRIPSSNPQESTDDRGLARLLGEIDALVPLIAASATRAEADRRVPRHIQQRLKTAGLYRMVLPRSLGGLNLDPAAFMEVVQRVARVDGSLGWLAAVAGIGPLFAPVLGSERFGSLYSAGPDLAFSASSQPSGTVEAVADGWRVNGRWPFASGCNDADWILVHCRVIENGQPVPGMAPGMPATRFALLPKAQVQIADSWYAMGLRATDSHHVVVENVIIPVSDAVDLATGQPCISGPLYKSPFQIVALAHNPIALGIAEAALDDLLAMAHGGRHQLNAATAQKESGIFRYEVAQIQADLRAVQAYSDASIKRLWEGLQAGTVPPGPPLPETLQASVWVTQACRKIVRGCFELGGGSVVYDTSPLQRRLRDIEVAAQHTLVQRRNYEMIGEAILANSEPNGASSLAKS